MPQTPAVHVGLPFAGFGHAWLQVPQLLTSEVTSVQVEPHIMLGAVHDAWHA
jgi:hypothetical protein